MSIFNKRTGTSLLATASCLAALTLFNGCGGGGGGGGDLNLGINGSTFASAVTLPNANNTSNGICSGRSGNLQVTGITISVNPNNNQIAVGLSGPNIQGFTFSQGGFDPSTRRVNFRGVAIETNDTQIPVLFDGILSNARQPNTLSGTLDFTCWRGFVNLVAQTGGDGRPENDDFANAIPISGSSGSIGGTTEGNSGEPGEPNHACLSRDRFTGEVNSVWYRWTAPSTGQFRFFSTNSGFETGTTNRRDPTIAIYTGNALNALTFGPANDDIVRSVDLNFCATLDATAGQVYQIAIASFEGDSGSFTLNWAPGRCTNANQASCTGENSGVSGIGTKTQR